MPAADPAHPCLSCGACCATYRVSFYWGEILALRLPEQLTEKLNPAYSCMSGTNQPEPRCHALVGEIGRKAACGIYDARPSPCRELQPGDDKCARARRRHGLEPLPAWAGLTLGHEATCSMRALFDIKPLIR